MVAPVPAFGIFINPALKKNLILQLPMSFINLEIGEHDGGIFDTAGTLSWFFGRHVGRGPGRSSADVFYQNNGDPKFIVELRQDSVDLKFSVVF